MEKTTFNIITSRKEAKNLLEGSNNRLVFGTSSVTLDDYGEDGKNNPGEGIYSVCFFEGIPVRDHSSTINEEGKDVKIDIKIKKDLKTAELD